MHLHTDVMLNISNWFGDYKPDRTYEAIPLAGIGFAHSWKNSCNNNILTFTAGLVNNFQLLPSLDLNVELRGMLVFKDKFDGVETNSEKEGMASATIGFTYRFNQKISSHKKDIKIQEGSRSGPAFGSIEMTEAEITAEKIRRLVNELETRNAEITRISKQLQQLCDNQISRLENDTVHLAIFFRIGKTELSETDIINLKYLSKKIKNSKFKYYVIGFADSATRTPSLN